MVHVAILGATGYTGGDLLRILSRHPDAVLTHATTTSKPGVPIADVHPDLRGIVDGVLEPFDAPTIAADTQIVFSCLPHTESQRSVAELARRNPKLKVVDFSADFRFADAGSFEAAYKVKHEAPELLKQTAYGLPELFRAAIQRARIVANPGCYPTTVITTLTPLAKAGLIDGPVLVDAKSGVSGAGATPTKETHFVEANESVRAYKPFEHRHQPEMEEQVHAASQHPVTIRFVPHLVPMNRGILSTMYVQLSKKKTVDEVRAVFAAAYGKEPFVRLLPSGVQPDTKNVTNTNFLDIGIATDPGSRLVCLTSALDNLVKGASGQAVQNMNLLAGLPETTGLRARVNHAKNQKEVIA